VQAKCQTDPRNLLHVIYNRGVPLVDRDQLVHPMRKGMRSGGRNPEPITRRQFGQLIAKINDLLSGGTGISADVGVQLHYRLVQLWFNALFQNHFAVCQDLLDVRTQLPRLRIDDLEFFFNSQSEYMIASMHFFVPRAGFDSRLSNKVRAICQDVGAAVFHLIRAILPKQTGRSSAVFAIH
jgi:hypothetical protein